MREIGQDQAIVQRNTYACARALVAFEGGYRKRSFGRYVATFLERDVVPQCRSVVAMATIERHNVTVNRISFNDARAWGRALGPRDRAALDHQRERPAFVHPGEGQA